MQANALKPGYSWNPLKKFPRNAFCPCGSKVKFKKCCKPKVDAAPGLKNEYVSEVKEAVKNAKGLR